MSKAQGLASSLFDPSSRNMEAACEPRVPEKGRAAPSPSNFPQPEYDELAVLIVEDEQHLADGLRFNLEAEGYDAEVVGDGETALKLLTDAASPL